MANPSRRKGTGEETAIVDRWNTYFGREVARRTSASSTYDVRVQVDGAVHPPIQVLSTRPDRGRRLYTLTEQDFLELFGSGEFHANTPVHIEAKRYARFSLHTIFEKKFGGKK